MLALARQSYRPKEAELNIKKRKEADRLYRLNYNKNYRKTHYEEIKEQQKQYRRDHKLAKAQYRRDHRPALAIRESLYRKLHPEIYRANCKRQREKLTDAIVRKDMSRYSVIKRLEWPQSLVELRRQLIKTRRLLHEIRC
jgi:hypothetical protein